LLPTLGLPDAELTEVSSLVQANGQGSYLVRAPRYKTNLQINLLPPLAVYPTLDAALVSDYLVLLMSSQKEVQLEGEAVLRCLQAQCGGVEVIPVVQVRAGDGKG
jgi:pre-rRNA-processing protein TSR1